MLFFCFRYYGFLVLTQRLFTTITTKCVIPIDMEHGILTQ